MNQSQFLVIVCNSLKARENSREHCAIGFGFALILIGWKTGASLLITKRSNGNQVIAFDSHLKIALYVIKYIVKFVVIIMIFSKRFNVEVTDCIKFGTPFLVPKICKEK